MSDVVSVVSIWTLSIYHAQIFYLVPVQKQKACWTVVVQHTSTHILRISYTCQMAGKLAWLCIVVSEVIGIRRALQHAHFRASVCKVIVSRVGKTWVDAIPGNGVAVASALAWSHTLVIGLMSEGEVGAPWRIPHAELRGIISPSASTSESAYSINGVSEDHVCLVAILAEITQRTYEQTSPIASYISVIRCRTLCLASIILHISEQTTTAAPSTQRYSWYIVGKLIIRTHDHTSTRLVHSITLINCVVCTWLRAYPIGVVGVSPCSSRTISHAHEAKPKGRCRRRRTSSHALHIGLSICKVQSSTTLHTVSTHRITILGLDESVVG